VKTITAKELKGWLGDGREIALIDLREQSVFYREHQFLAVSIPLSHLELRIGDMVPRRTTRIVLVDQGGKENLARRAARRLETLGYSSVTLLDGGIDAWKEAGYEVFSGVNVPSKAFGEMVEKSCNTPRLTADEVQRKITEGDNLVIVDARPGEEYRLSHIPCGIDTPGAELVLRIHDLAPDPETFVVVNCAGRTRSIIGAQSLINAGIANPVAALKDGTMGWHLAGFQLEYDMERHAPAPSEDGLTKAKACAEHVAKRFGVKKINSRTLEQWKGNADNRTLYILDVRLPDEFETGHLEHSRNVPGGQLIQATDEYVAVRNARIVLVDTTEVQSVMTASWLIQMGWSDVYVLEGGIADMPKIPGPSSVEIPGFVVWSRTISPHQLRAKIDSRQNIAVIDLAYSKVHAREHIPGAWWCVRSRLAEKLHLIPESDGLVLTSQDGILAHLAAGDIKEYIPFERVTVLDGGNDAWIQAGCPVEKGINKPMCEIDDLWYKPYEQKDASEQAMRDYLTWEVALIERVERDGNAGFRIQNSSPGKYK
jgi:rhodanese-related sulfurtransferase